VALQETLHIYSFFLLRSSTYNFFKRKKTAYLFIFFSKNVFQEPGMVETLSKNITRQGLTATTLNYLRVSNEVNSRIETLQEGVDPDTLPLPGAQTLTGQNMSQHLDTLDFGSEPFQFQ
jgi:hypothetical protein